MNVSGSWIPESSRGLRTVDRRRQIKAKRLARFWALPIAFVGLVGVVSVPANAASPSRQCKLVDDDAYLASSPKNSDGLLKAQEWLANDKAQADVQVLNDNLSKLGSPLVGTAVDHRNRRIVIVADPDGESVTNLRASVSKLKLGVKVEVIAGCHSQADLAAAIDWITKVGEPSYPTSKNVYFVDAASAQVKINVTDAQFGAVLSEKFGGLVDVTNEQMQIGDISGNRIVDHSPHYGDAAIYGRSGACSTNFTFVTVFGVRTQATAGHCAYDPDNGVFQANDYVTHDGTPYGSNSAGNWSVYPLEMQLISAGSQTYTNSIYTDPGSPTVRQVTSEADLGVGAFVCVGGFISGSNCNNEIYAVNQTWGGKTQLQFTRILAAGNPAPCVPGDSGGAVYQRGAGTTAIAVGMAIDTLLSNDQIPVPVPYFGYWICINHTVASIKAKFGVTLLTTP